MRYCVIFLVGCVMVVEEEPVCDEPESNLEPIVESENAWYDAKCSARTWEEGICADAYVCLQEQPDSSFVETCCRPVDCSCMVALHEGCGLVRAECYPQCFNPSWPDVPATPEDCFP